MELLRYAQILRSRWLMIVATTLLAAVGGYLGADRSVTYVATSVLVVGPRQFTDAEGNLNRNATDTIAPVINTLAAMVTSPPIAERAVTATGIDRSPLTLAQQTVATRIGETQLLGITVVDQDPALAQRLANGLADAFVQQVSDFDPTAPAAEGTVPFVDVYVFQRATLPSQPSPVDTQRSVLVTALFGLAAAAALALLLDYLDLTMATPEQAEAKLGLPILGAIPRTKAAWTAGGRGRADA